MFVYRRLTFFRPKADLTPLAARNHVDWHDHGLVGVEGAQTVINALKGRKYLEELNIGRNALGDEGCRELFNFLKDNIKTLRIRHISMNACNLGNPSMVIIGSYLMGSDTDTLFMQNNNFTADPWVAHRFATSLNQSKLRCLDLTGNPKLGDVFLEGFLMALDAPIRDMRLSVMGLTAASGKPLGAYLASSRSSGLRILKCNGNHLNLDFVDSLIDALKTNNFALAHIELFGNALTSRKSESLESVQNVNDDNDTGSSHASSQDLTAPSPSNPPPPPRPKRSWGQSERLMNRLLERNKIYRAMVMRQATSILPLARVLFCKSRAVEGRFNQSIVSLPTELRIEVLGYLAPALSVAQCHRICQYAAVPKQLAFNHGPVLDRDESRDQWLLDIACDIFEPSNGWEEKMGQLLAGDGL